MKDCLKYLHMAVHHFGHRLWRHVLLVRVNIIIICYLWEPDLSDSEDEASVLPFFSLFFFSLLAKLESLPLSLLSTCPLERRTAGCKEMINQTNVGTLLTYRVCFLLLFTWFNVKLRGQTPSASTTSHPLWICCARLIFSLYNLRSTRRWRFLGVELTCRSHSDPVRAGMTVAFRRAACSFRADPQLMVIEWEIEALQQKWVRIWEAGWRERWGTLGLKRCLEEPWRHACSC